jgi:hypothetical protein
LHGASEGEKVKHHPWLTEDVGHPALAACKQLKRLIVRYSKVTA